MRRYSTLKYKHVMHALRHAPSVSIQCVMATFQLKQPNINTVTDCRRTESRFHTQRQHWWSRTDKYVYIQYAHIRTHCSVVAACAISYLSGSNSSRASRRPPRGHNRWKLLCFVLRLAFCPRPLLMLVCFL